MIIEEIYDALIEAGASENKARAAARAMTNYETRISKIESDLSLLKWNGWLQPGPDRCRPVSCVFLKAWNSLP
jgi:hypothetical protein